MSLGEAPFKLVAISAGTSEPSTTRMLADRAVQATVKQLRETGRNSSAHLRPLFAFLRTIAAPTALFAEPADCGSSELGKRIDRAAGELAALIISGIGRDIADAEWAGYQHSFAGNATRAEHSAADVDFDTDLMRLARGGN